MRCDDLDDELAYNQVAVESFRKKNEEEESEFGMFCGSVYLTTRADVLNPYAYCELRRPLDLTDNEVVAFDESLTKMAIEVQRFVQEYIEQQPALRGKVRFRYGTDPRHL